MCLENKNILLILYKDLILKFQTETCIISNIAYSHGRQKKILNKNKRDLKITFTCSGGTGKGGTTTRLTIPTTWIRQMGITKDDRDVEVELTDKNEIIIKKKCDNNTL